MKIYLKKINVYLFRSYFFTCDLFLVTLKKSLIRVWLLPPPSTFFLSRSCRLPSRVWRKFSIRRWIRSTLQMETIWNETKIKKLDDARNAGVKHTYLTLLVWHRNLTKASSSGSDHVSSEVTVSGGSKNNLRASLYFHRCGTGWVWKEIVRYFARFITNWKTV